ncbi:AraC-type DNA-binding protein [Pseudomonas cuatrocienegasensis]|uniref:AraC-type DNA-binding protein n=1 Tax=Pseudomonas cuatrocienegasensis TaxID=543360 RepID=A0ABY1B8X8_9PSED|nr:MULTISPECIES: helix-turn-helix domain-containing protein [Pseudomonas]OEC35702.1 AraC family transcriptional regulator [Pseudomonas sp. 21C1]SEQ24196.1 AraC-type DNA-binding protein [Pseudomonas cuatrocienegasensis]
MLQPGALIHQPHLTHLAHDRFDVGQVPMHQQLLAWRERVGHVIDVLPAKWQLEQPFLAAIDRYRLGEWTLTDCYSDPLLLSRSLARISTDNKRDYVFQVFINGGMSLGPSKAHNNRAPYSAGILLLDLNQPLRMQRSACRVLSLFAPRACVDSLFPDAESLHGRVLDSRQTEAGILIEHLQALAHELPAVPPHEALMALEYSAQSLLGAFTKQAKLSGNARAAARSLMFSRVRRYIKHNLYSDELSPERVLLDLRLPRATVYRLFEHEGGLAAYILRCRLREAAEQLFKCPQTPVLDIAYSLGFGSASDFTRAFRRVHEMAPRDFRLSALAPRC